MIFWFGCCRFIILLGWYSWKSSGNVSRLRTDPHWT